MSDDTTQLECPLCGYIGEPNDFEVCEIVICSECYANNAWDEGYDEDDNEDL